jgi:hypothetical protein
VGRRVAGRCDNSQLTTPPRLAWILSATKSQSALASDIFDMLKWIGEDATFPRRIP